MSTAPVEAKVYAATIGTGAGAVLSAFTVWLLGVLVWQAPFTAEGATAAVASVPGPVVGIVGLVITVGASFLGGYWAKHTPRPETVRALERVQDAEHDAEPAEQPPAPARGLPVEPEGPPAEQGGNDLPPWPADRM